MNYVTIQSLFTSVKFYSIFIPTADVFTQYFKQNYFNVTVINVN